MSPSPISAGEIIPEKPGWLPGLAHKVLEFTHGRTTAFFVAFFISGNFLACFGKLTPVYVAFMGTLLGAIVGHSVKEDIFQAKSDAAVAAAGGSDANNKS